MGSIPTMMLDLSTQLNSSIQCDSEQVFPFHCSVGSVSLSWTRIDELQCREFALETGEVFRLMLSFIRRK